MNDSLLNKNIIEAIRSAYAAPTAESVTSKSAERQGVMARTQSKINTALEDTAQDALASVEALIGKTIDARTDKDISMEELAKQSAEENAKYRASMGITESLRKDSGDTSENIPLDLGNQSSDLLSTSKDEEVSAPVTAEPEVEGLMIRPKARPELEPTARAEEASEAALFSKIVGGESDDYNTVFLGSKVKPPKPITEMTVKEVREWQDTSVNAGSKSSAAGRFQIIRSTMDTLLSSGAIDETDIFDEETQLKAYTALLKKRKYPQLKLAIQNSTDPDEKRKYAENLQINLAMEFASIPVPKPIKKDYFGKGLPIVDLKKGQSFYYDPKKPNLNKAQHKSDAFMNILMEL